MRPTSRSLTGSFVALALLVGPAAAVACPAMACELPDARVDAAATADCHGSSTSAAAAASETADELSGGLQARSQPARTGVCCAPDVTRTSAPSNVTPAAASLDHPAGGPAVLRASSDPAPAGPSQHTASRSRLHLHATLLL